MRSGHGSSGWATCPARALALFGVVLTGRHPPSRSIVGFFALCVPLYGAHAAGLPGTGELLQEVPAPSVPPPAQEPGLIIEQPAPSPAPTSAPFLVQHIEIEGNTSITTSELRRLVEADEGKWLTLAALEALATRITKYYQDHGYLLSRAYLPAQTVHDATVRIAVLEARYGKVTLTNTSEVSESRLKSIVAPLQAGDPVSAGPLETRLLLLSDVPGTVVNSTLAPGETPGSSDLLITAAPGPAETGSIGLDDAGNRYTGRLRLNATLNINNPLHLGDVLTLSGMTTGSDLSYARLGYQSLVDGQGTTLGGAVSGLDYRLANGLSDLRAHGTAQVETLTLMQPLVRSTEGNLFAQLALDSKQLHDEVDASAIHTDRRATELTATLAGDSRDASGISNMNLEFTLGHLEFQNPESEQADALGARTRGNYDKFGVSLARLQALTEFDSLYVAVNGQLADRNLDTSDQFFLGGPNSVRSYDVGAVGGALGILASIEWRHTLTIPIAGTWQAIAFLDSGVVRFEKTPVGPGPNSATLAGAGLGLTWAGPNGWVASADLATPVGAAPTVLGRTSSVRFWFELHKSFAAGSDSLPGR